MTEREGSRGKAKLFGLEVDVSRFRVDGIELYVSPDLAMYATKVRAVLRVPDRDHGGPSAIWQSHAFAEHAMGLQSMRGTLIREVRRMLREALLRELDECLLIDGERVFDPHKDEK